MLIRETTLPDPRAGRRARDPRDRRLRVRDGQQLQRRPAAARRVLHPTATHGWSCAARPSRTCMGETYRVGLLGHGTVGAAFEQLLGERADAIAHITGRKPEVTGVLTRSRGDFEQILADSDLIVELIGGIEPARDYVLRAMRAGKHVVSRQQAAARLARRGAVGRPRASTASSCASRAPWPASCRSSACCRSRSPARTWSASTGSSTAPRTSSSPRWRAAAPPTPTRSQRAQELGYAEADPTDDVTGRDAAAKMAILARLAFSTPVAPRPGDLRGHRAHHAPRTSPTRATSASA